MVQAEARTRVQAAIHGMRDELMQEVTEMVRAEVPPMVRMGVETLPGSISARHLHEDIKALTQSLQEEKSRVQVLEGRLNLCMMGRIEGPTSGTKGRTSPKGTRRKSSRQAKAKARRRKYGGVSDSAAEEGDESENPFRNSKKSRQGSKHRKSSFRGHSNHRHGRGYADDEKDDDDSPSNSSEEDRSPSSSSSPDSEDPVRKRDRSQATPLTHRNWMGSKEQGLKQVQSSDHRFKKVLSYRRYRLRNSSGRCGPNMSYNTGPNAQRVAHVMNAHVFDGNDPISILSFPTRFNQQMDANLLSKGAFLFIFPSFLDVDAKVSYENNFDLPPDQGGFTMWPKAVHFLLRTFARDAYIEEALARLEELCQDPEEKEVAYAKRLRKQGRRCVSVCTEQDMINRFIRGLRADLRPLLRALRADYSLLNAFQDYVERTGAQGDAYRALFGRTLPSMAGSGSSSPMRLKLKTTAPRRRTPVYNMERGQIHCDDGV